MSDPTPYVHYENVEVKGKIRIIFELARRTVSVEELTTRADELCQRKHGHTERGVEWAECRNEAARQMLIEGAI